MTPRTAGSSATADRRLSINDGPETAAPSVSVSPSEPTHGVRLWSSPVWRANAVEWLDQRLAAVGLERTGEVEQPHLRPWATVLRAPTTGGDVWFKAAGPATGSEIGLYGLLGAVVPYAVLTPIALDVARGWMVLPDGGPSLDGSLAEIDFAIAMARILPPYADLQRALVPHGDALLELGLEDMRPANMPRRFDEALAAAEKYVRSHGTAADAATLRHLEVMRERVRSWCERLGALPGGWTVDHGDLHQWNVLIGADGLERPKFFDWGDAAVAHPFASLLVALSFLRDHVGRGDDAPEVVRARDAYLDTWSDLGPRGELVEAVELACRVGKVARALTGVRWISELTGSEAETYGRWPFESLTHVLDDSYLGCE